jgi:hypothetical protein
MAIAVVVAVAAGLLPGGAARAGVVTVEPPIVPAVVGLLGAGLVGAALLGSRPGEPALALLGFALVAVGDDLAAGRAVALDRLAAAGLVIGAALLPLLRYGALTYEDLRSASSVLGSPIATGPGLRQLECVLGAAVGVGATAWLARDRVGVASPFTVAARPAAMLPGAAALLLVGSFAGPTVHGAGSTIPWIAGVLLVSGACVVLSRVAARLPAPGFVALMAAILVAGAAAGLAS